MNCPTTRCSTPAAAPRTGRGEGAPRGTQYKTSIPFAAIPHDIAADPRLSPTDLRVLAALFYFARADASCWPCDNSIAARVHRHPGTVRRSLRHLEDLGYIRREPSRENPTGRLIHLTCREPDWERPRQAPVPSAGARGIERRRAGGSAPAHAEGDVIVERLRTEEFALPERSRPDPAPPPYLPPQSHQSYSSLKFPPFSPLPPGTITTGSGPTARGSPHPDRGGPAPGQGSAPAPAPPVIDPPQPELSVAAPAPVVVPPQPQSPPLRRSGLPRAQDALGLVPPRPSRAPGRPRSLDARAIGCRPGPSCSTSATPVSNPAKARAWATRGPPCDQDAPSRVPGPEPRPPLDARAAGAARRDAGGVPRPSTPLAGHGRPDPRGRGPQEASPAAASASRPPRPCPSCWGGSERTRPTLPWRHPVWQQPFKIKNPIRGTCAAVRRRGGAS